jgi:hypothetical protein
MTSATDDAAITFNREIYKFLELKPELQMLGGLVSLRATPQAQSPKIQ